MSYEITGKLVANLILFNEAKLLKQENSYWKSQKILVTELLPIM